MPQVVAIPKTEYQKILKNQEELRLEVSALRQVVVNELGEELRPAVKKRLEKISKELDRGGGEHFDSIGEFRDFMRKL